jgi:hypothetical protein
MTSDARMPVMAGLRLNCGTSMHSSTPAESEASQRSCGAARMCASQTSVGPMITSASGRVMALVK